MNFYKSFSHNASGLLLNRISSSIKVMDVHFVICSFKELAISLGRTPKRDEFVKIIPKSRIDKLFGGYAQLVAACGLVIEKQEAPKKFKFNKQSIESFVINKADIDDLFVRAGNPESLKMIFQPDTHMENRDEAALGVFLKFTEWYQPHIFMIGGDLIDAEGISHWPQKGLKPRRFIPEVLLAREYLSKLKKITNSVMYIYLEGNHEDWINQAMSARMPEFFDGLEEIGLMPDLKSLLDLDKFGFNLIPVNELFQIGKANFTHGLYCGNNHPKKHLDVIKGNIYYGHLHDVMATHQPSIGGFLEAASLGCLCKLDAPFLKGKPNNWAHAFGVFEFFKDGSYSFYCPRIFNGKFSFNGKVFSY